MYQKILIAVDGSDCSMRAVEAGLDVAGALGATAVILTVTPTWKSVGLSELAIGVSEEQFAVRTHEQAEQRLAKVAESSPSPTCLPCKPCLARKTSRWRMAS